MTTTVLNAKIGEVEIKIPGTSGLVINIVYNIKMEEVQSKIHDLGGLVKKTDYNIKMSDNEGKYSTTTNYNTFSKEILDAKIKEQVLVEKSDISGFIDNSDLNKKLATLATKAGLKTEPDKIVKIQTLGSSYFCGKSHFEGNKTQNYLVFEPVLRY